MKNKPSDLALLGGIPAFDQPLHVGRPNVGDEKALWAHLAGALDARVLSNHGPLLQRFEDRLRERLGTRYCVAVANGTLGLMLSARAMGLRDEVIVPSFTFVGTAHALLWQGLTPIFCDIDPVTYQIDPSDVEALVTPRTSAIVAVHLFGRTCDMDALEAIARRRRLKLLVDAAHSMGCSIQGRPVAGRGDVAVFSFHATKVMNTFEGGAIATDDPEVANSLRLMSSFGFSDLDRVDCLGINAKMSEAAAAMGLVSLDSLDDFIAANRRNYEAYRRALAHIPGVRLLPYPDPLASNCHYIVAEVDGGEGGLSRDGLLRVLRAENVLARRYFYPGCHRMEPYASAPRWRNARLPATERACARVLALPTGTAVGDREIETIAGVIRTAMEAGADLANRLSAIPTGSGRS